MKIQITDQGREFVNSMSENLHMLTGVNHRIATAYHPQTNGLDERFNRTLQEAIAKQVDSEQRDWDDLIDGILFAYRTSVHDSTKQTPFFIMYGRKARLPVEMEDTTSMSDGGMEKEQLSMEDKVEQMQGIRTQIHQDAAKHIKLAQSRQKKNYDARHTPAVSCVVHVRK